MEQLLELSAGEHSRVAMDCQVIEINLKCQLKYLITFHQFSDVFIRVSAARDWILSVLV
jgi:hypothetical protein